MDLGKAMHNALEEQYEKRQAEEKRLHNKKIMKWRVIVNLFSLVIWLIGFAIIVSHLGWWVAIGLWLVIFGINISQLCHVGKGNGIIDLFNDEKSLK